MTIVCSLTKTYAIFGETKIGRLDLKTVLQHVHALLQLKEDDEIV
ncbi:MAG: hypothetical protein QXY74_06750 [Candidatus Bathyarchaeia archaeon]